MAFSKNDHQKAESHLRNNGWKPLQNSNGFQKDGHIWKPSDSNGSWVSPTHGKYSSWSDFSKSKKTK